MINYLTKSTNSHLPRGISAYISFSLFLCPQRKKKKTCWISLTFVTLISDILFSKSYFEIFALLCLISAFSLKSSQGFFYLLIFSLVQRKQPCWLLSRFTWPVTFSLAFVPLGPLKLSTYDLLSTVTHPLMMGMRRWGDFVTLTSKSALTQP